jgi:hypothetical protein
LCQGKSNAIAVGGYDDPAFALRNAFLRCLHAEELVRPRHLLVGGVENDEVANQIDQPRLAARLRERAVWERARRIQYRRGKPKPPNRNQSLKRL